MFVEDFFGASARSIDFYNVASTRSIEPRGNRPKDHRGDGEKEKERDEEREERRVEPRGFLGRNNVAFLFSRGEEKVSERRLAPLTAG